MSSAPVQNPTTQVLGAGFPAAGPQGPRSGTHGQAAPYLSLHGIDPGPDYPGWLTARSPGAQVEVWAEHGHYPHPVAPDRFCARVEEFVAETRALNPVNSVGVTYLNTADWGIPAYSAFKAEADKIGLKITDAEGVLDTSDDYRPSLTKAVAGKPQAFVHIGYGPDAAKLVSQLRAVGYQGTFYGGQDEQSFDGTPEADGSIVGAEFLETSPDPAVQAFVKAFKAKYPNEKDVTGFEAGAYDALNVAVAAAKLGGTTRDGILKGFQQLKDVPSVVYGEITFDQTTRRVQSPKLTPTILKGGKWVAYTG